MIRQESLFISIGSSGEERLHVRRIFDDAQKNLGPPVLLLHGAIENARIFYTESGKGLGPFLARQGYEVYVADLRGRGQSTPPISRHSKHGQFEAITEELPAFSELIRLRRGNVPQLWAAHSWGGVLMLSHLVRSEVARKQVAGMVLFGTKRSIHVRSRERTVQIDLFWRHFGRWVVRLWGYLPARELRVGSENETARFYREMTHWVEPNPWVDPRDGFSYERIAPTLELPPMLFFAGKNDTVLGHPKDVRAFIRELGRQEVEFRLLGRMTGSLQDYDHIDLLTHPDAERDHFMEVVRFFSSVLNLK